MRFAVAAALGRLANVSPSAMSPAPIRMRLLGKSGGTSGRDFLAGQNRMPIKATSSSTVIRSIFITDLPSMRFGRYIRLWELYLGDKGVGVPAPVRALVWVLRVKVGRFGASCDIDVSVCS